MSLLNDSLLAKCTPPCKLSDLDAGLVSRLESAQSVCSVPIVINSAFRSKDWELSKGRSGTSSHCLGLAVDIKCVTSSDRFELVNALLYVGFTRIGIGRNFIHVDCDENKVGRVIFHYYPTPTK